MTENKSKIRLGITVSLVVLGISSVIIQAIILRELMVSFYGNEFFVGLILAAWLFWVAASSKTAERIKRLAQIKVIVLLHFLVWLLLPLDVLLIRWSKNWFGFPGEIPNLFASLFCASFFLLPVCLLLGFLWTASTRLYAGNLPSQNTNKAYLLETIGFILGGVLFSFVLINISGSLIIPESLRFKNQTLIETDNSPYGNIAVSQTNGQYNFFESGLLLGSTENIEFAETFSHLSLLQHPSPQKVLLIGNGFNGLLQEILKHPIEKVYYLELDPKIIEVAQKYISPELKEVLKNPKVEILNIDGRYFLQKTKEKVDVILLNLPDPSTALINRFYTKEFFEKAKLRLNKNGILATYLTFSPSAPGKNLTNLNASIFKTLKQTFRKVIILPEETNFLLASQDAGLTYNTQLILQRFNERNIKTRFLSPPYITYLLSNDRAKTALNLFAENKEAKQNKDVQPVAYFYQTLFWLERLYPKVSQFFKHLALRTWWFLAAAFFLQQAYSWLRKKRKTEVNPVRKELSNGVKAAIASIIAAGFSLMALETIIIFNYQIVIGYLYYRLALLISSLMAGIALGVWCGNKKAKAKGILLKIHLSLIIFSLISFPIFTILPKTPSSAAEIIFVLLTIAAGFLGGLVFPISNHIYLSFQKEPNKKTGVIYSADLFGSCLGALLPGLVLIPVFGVWQALLFVAAANLWAILTQVK